MNPELIEINEKQMNQFHKIKFLNSLSNQLVDIGFGNGFKNLPDIVDLNCGAIPDGPFEQVVDLSSPNQFLSMYTQIAESRFACVVTELIKCNEIFFQIIKELCFQSAKLIQLENLFTIKDAYNSLTNFVLDGMPDNEKRIIIEETESKITWEKNIDIHEKAWTRFGGDIKIYYTLQQIFVNAVINKFGFEYKTDDCKIFSIEKKAFKN